MASRDDIPPLKLSAGKPTACSGCFGKCGEDEMMLLPAPSLVVKQEISSRTMVALWPSLGIGTSVIIRAVGGR